MNSAQWAPLAVVLAALAFTAYCLWDLARTTDTEVRGLDRPLWAVVLVLTSVIGAVLWIAYGRPRPR